MHDRIKLLIEMLAIELNTTSCGLETTLARELGDRPTTSSGQDLYDTLHHSIRLTLKAHMDHTPNMECDAWYQKGAIATLRNILAKMGPLWPQRLKTEAKEPQMEDTAALENPSGEDDTILDTSLSSGAPRDDMSEEIRHIDRALNKWIRENTIEFTIGIPTCGTERYVKVRNLSDYIGQLLTDYEAYEVAPETCNQPAHEPNRLRSFGGKHYLAHPCRMNKGHKYNHKHKLTEMLLPKGCKLTNKDKE